MLGTNEYRIVGILSSLTCSTYMHLEDGAYSFLHSSFFRYRRCLFLFIFSSERKAYKFFIFAYEISSALQKSRHNEKG